MRNGTSARCARPSQRNTEGQRTTVSTAASAAITTSWPTLMPDMTAALAMPVRTGKARVTMTPTGIIEAAPLPSA